MAPTLLLLATHVVLALNLNRYGASESYEKNNAENVLRSKNHSNYGAARIHEGPWNTSKPESNEDLVKFKNRIIDEITEGESNDNDTAAIDESSTASNSINFTQIDYNTTNEETVERLHRNNTTHYYNQNFDSRDNGTNAHSNREFAKHLKESENDNFINVSETGRIKSSEINGISKCSLANKKCSAKFNQTNKSLLINLIQSRMPVKSFENIPVSRRTRLMDALKPTAPGFIKISMETHETERQIRPSNGTRNNYFENRNVSALSELIFDESPAKPSAIKKSRSASGGDRSIRLKDAAGDVMAVFNITLEQPLRTTNSFPIAHRRGILSDSPSRKVEPSHLVSAVDSQVATVASLENLYTTTREVSETYVNRFTKFLPREKANTDPVSTSASRADTVYRIFQEGLKTNKKKTTLQSAGEPVTESTRFFDVTRNNAPVNLNFRGVGSSTYSPAKRNLVELDVEFSTLPAKIYDVDVARPCLDCTSANDTKLSRSTPDFENASLTNVILVSRVANSTDNNVFARLNVSTRPATLGPEDNAVGITTPASFADATEELSDIYDGLLTMSTVKDRAASEINPTPAFIDNDAPMVISNSSSARVIAEFPWPVKKEAVVEGDLVLGGLMMVHEREDTITCGPVMPQGGIQALEAMLYTLDRLNGAPTSLLPNITLGAHILDDCDKDTYGLEMAVDFIKGEDSVFFPFALGVYQWTGSTESYFQATGQIVSLIGLGVGVPILSKVLQLSDFLIIVVGLIDKILSNVVFLTVRSTCGLYMGSISNIDGAEYHCNKTQVRKVISGVVGAASSVTSIQVANLLRLFKIPQVSFFSTSPELSNKQRFEYFTRTIPSDHYQVKAMVDIVRLMGWSYISIIYEESNYGIKAFEELEDLLADYNICIAVKEKLVKDSGVADESAYDNIVQKLLTKPRARGTIIFGSDQEVAGVMRAVKRSNATGSFSWIGSDGWSARSLVSDGNEAEVEGTLSVQPQANPVRGFEEYFLNLNVENNRRNPWFVEFWEDHFQCRYPNSSLTPYNHKYAHLCTGKEKLTRQNTVFENQLQFVSDAVMAFAYAIRDMHRDLCPDRPGLCDAMKPTKGTELLKYLRKVNFEGLSGDRFHFDINGDGPARYNIIHFKQVSAGKYRWIRVGEYLEGELKLNMTEIQFKLGHPKPPESVCSLPCDLGQAKKYVEGESCCWHCFNCTQYQIRHPTDPTQCVGCPLGTVPDPLHVRCIDIPEEYLRPESGWAIGAMGLSSTGILITTFVVCVFIRYNDTPVVRASGRELSYVLLAGILMCYCVTFALVFRPTDIVCGIQRFGAGFCFTVVYAALLTKTNRISRIFNAGKHSAKRPSFISPRSQLIICSGLMVVQVLINGVWMVISPAKAMHHYPTREDNLLVCSTDIDASYMIAFTYPILLIVICTVYAVLTRKIPEAFNESKHIGFTMYTTCVIWLAFVPLYFGTANHVALRITSMSVTISLSASVTVSCLFSPKLYIILIRPERNIRQSMMPMRYSAINKGSGTAGSGSMMAPVMVTAATCDQKQQIQKHVPPLKEEPSEKDDTDSEHKTKPKMIDCGTLTDPPPPAYSESVLNNSEEFIPKMNNNCNVGNGPLTLLPGMQIKDIPL